MEIRLVLKGAKDRNAKHVEAFQALTMAERGALAVRGAAPETPRAKTLAEIGAETLAGLGRVKPKIEKAQRAPAAPAPSHLAPHGRPLSMHEALAIQKGEMEKLADAYRELASGYGYKPNG